MSSRPADVKATDELASGGDWALVALLCGVALLSGVLEVLLVPLYVGSVIFPLTVVLAVFGNVVLPRAGFAMVHAGAGALLPVLAWFVPVIGLVAVSPPGGDVLVPGGGNEQWVYYAVVLLGGGAGFATFVATGAQAEPQLRGKR